MGAPNVMAYLYRHGAGVSCLELLHILSWSVVLARLDVALLFGSLLRRIFVALAMLL
jgi:hypothetical protein